MSDKFLSVLTSNQPFPPTLAPFFGCNTGNSGGGNASSMGKPIAREKPGSSSSYGVAGLHGHGNSQNKPPASSFYASVGDSEANYVNSGHQQQLRIDIDSRPAPQQQVIVTRSGLPAQMNLIAHQKVESGTQVDSSSHVGVTSVVADSTTSDLPANQSPTTPLIGSCSEITGGNVPVNVNIGYGQTVSHRRIRADSVQ